MPWRGWGAWERELKDRYRSHGFWALQVESFQMLISRRTSMDVFVCYANEALIALHCIALLKLNVDPGS